MRPTRRNPRPRQNVNQRGLLLPAKQNGFRLFFICTLISISLGYAIRNYLSEERLREWVDAAVAQLPKSGRVNLLRVDYKRIRISLADGAFPQFAIEIANVEISKTMACPGAAPIRAARLSFPLRVSALLYGKVVFSTIRADELDVDVDQLRSGCMMVAMSPYGELDESATGPYIKPIVPPNIKPPIERLAWWKPDDFFRMRNALEGVKVDRARLWFENKTKSVYLEKFRVALDPHDVAFLASGRMRIPRDLTEGEPLPDLEVTAVVREDEARLRTEARLSEGRLSGEARVTPRSARDLQVEARIQIANLPLSTAVPLVAKVAMIKRPMRPRFLWLNCSAEINGRFHRLFSDNPIEIRNCEMSGRGTSIQVSKATHLPNGDWQPFSAVVRSADVQQLLEMFSIGGFGGITANLGHLDGLIHVQGREVELDGQLDGMQLQFSNQNQRALQTIRNVQTHVALDSLGGVSGRISQMEVEGGEFDGNLKFDFTKSANTGRVQLDLGKLRLSPAVETLMTGGRTEGVTGKLVAEFERGRFANLQGDVRFHDFRSSEWEIEDLRVAPSLSREGDVQLKFRASSVFLLPQSPLHAASQSFLFTQFSPEAPIVFHETTIDGSVTHAGSFRWTNLITSGLAGRLRFSSQGQWTRDDRKLTGHLKVDYPAVKNLSWELGGTLSAPLLTFDEDSATAAWIERMKTDSVTDRDLGIARKK